MTDDIGSFLATSPIFKDMTPEQLSEIVPLFKSERHPAGTVVLHQGGYSPALYFLRSGRLVVRARRGGSTETVAYLQPPDIVGELSVLTGACCVTDVEVEVDAELVLLPKEVLPKLAAHGEKVFWGLLQEIAKRMQERVTLGQKIPELPTVLLHNHANWEAPFGFAYELTRSLARETGRPTLLANLGTASAHDVRSLNTSSGDVCTVAIAGSDERLRAEMADNLTLWGIRFKNVVLNPVGPRADAIVETLKGFANFRGHLLGPGDPLPDEVDGARFVVPSAVLPTLPFLDGGRQLVSDVAASESAHLAGRPVTLRFQHSADSIARRIAGVQVGVTLGGGAAWGWTHVGVLSVLEDAGVPIDCISGSSMGSIVAGLWSSGISVGELKELVHYWAIHSRELFERRFWHLCLLNERAIMTKILRQHFGDRLVNRHIHVISLACGGQHGVVHFHFQFRQFAVALNLHFQFGGDDVVKEARERIKLLVGSFFELRRQFESTSGYLLVHGELLLFMQTRSNCGRHIQPPVEVGNQYHHIQSNEITGFVKL